MRAMVLERQKLSLQNVPIPEPGAGQVQLKVLCCGVCRTDLHIVDGELPDLGKPVILGHQIVGEVTALGEGVENFTLGQRVGVPWLGWTCGKCEFCLRGEENLCEEAKFTGYQLPGGFAEWTVADARYAFPLGKGAPEQLAPLLCGGLIGYRAYRMAGGERLGFYGFGSAAHQLTQLAVHEGKEVYAFVRPGDEKTAAFAKQLGAVWAGGSDEEPPVPLDAALIFAPVGPLVPQALQSVRKGGVVVCAGIHMSEIPAFSYDLLWGERQVRSVANLTREDGEQFLAIAPKVPVKSHVHTYPLERTQEALDDLRRGKWQGSLVVMCQP